ncbi:MAG TPA: hypothetical protein VFT22_15300 [Kofleriaceae bacterium]|nr:hypothetical protein [Kofleriaceae bacterium]
MKNELAIDADGQPFMVPPEVTGWRVRRVEGRGRPELAYDRLGRPLLLAVDATHTDLLTAAGPGRYRLDPIDATGHICADVPVGCTGTIHAHPSPEREPTAHDLAGFDGPVRNTPVRPFVGYDDILCETIRANTRIAELVVSRIPAMLSATGELLMAADGASITKRQPLLPLPFAAPEPLEADDRRELALAAPVGLPEVLQLIIKEVVAKAVPMIIERFTGGGNAAMGGFPLDALFDWRKARVPEEPAAPRASSPPGMATAPSGTAQSTRSTAWEPHAPDESSTMRAATPTNPMPTRPSVPAMAMTATPQAAGAAPSHDSSLGAAPADGGPITAEAGARLNAHILAVWRGLSPAERATAGQLIARLSQEQRAAWLAELARLTVPEAIARARATLQAQAAPNTPELPSATASGDGT